MSQNQDLVKFDHEHSQWYSQSFNQQTQQYEFSSWKELGWQPSDVGRDSHREGGYTQPTAHNPAAPYNPAPGVQHQHPPYTQSSSSAVDEYGRPVALHPFTHTQPPQRQTGRFPRGRGAPIHGLYNSQLGSRPDNLHYEVLDPSFCVRDKKFFKEGRVFAIMHSENAGMKAATSYNTSLSVTEVAYQGNFIHTQKRRFVVVRQKREFCFACPIFTYSGRATTKHGAQSQEHCIVYSVGSQPQYIEGETGITKPSIGVVMTSTPRLQIASRIYYGIHHPIQYNVKVTDIGYVQEEDVPKLIGSWKEEDTGETKQDPDVTANAEVPERPQQEEVDKYLYHQINNPYGYHATVSANCFHPRLNPWGYHVAVNPYGYHPDWNPHGHHPVKNPNGHHDKIAPWSFHPTYNPLRYHPTSNLYVYHPKHNIHTWHQDYNQYSYHNQYNPTGHHPTGNNQYVYHPKHNPLRYHPTSNPLVYHPQYNPYTWHQEHNPYSYDGQYNSTGHYPNSDHQYAYHPKHAPHMYHHTANPFGFHTGFNPYGYHPDWNQYGYHPQDNPSGHHPTYNAGAYHPTYNPGSTYAPPSNDGGVDQLANTFRGVGLGSQ